mgnify:CR=1 FL=1
MEQETLDLRGIRLEKLRKLQEQGKNPYVHEKYERSNKATEILEKYDDLEGKVVSIAGRLMSKRKMGKASFINLLDSTGNIQAYVRQDRIGDESFEDFSTFDIGDIIGVKGEVFKTKTGEISVKADEVVLLTKTLQTLPEKHHGLKDKELRYRQRYVDLIVNPEVKDVFFKRNQIIRGIRSYLDGHGYLEVETPILTTVAGGANARPFLTHHNTLGIDMQLRIANELFLKRLIVGGIDRVYEMGKMFRNEGIDYNHNPEFTSIELYAAYEDYEYMMHLTEDLIEKLCLELHGTTEIMYKENLINFKTPWARVSMHESVEKKTGINFYAIDDLEEAKRIAKEDLQLEVEPFMNFGHLVELAFEEFCEEDLVQPTFVMHHPVEISPLAKKSSANPRVTNRFEAFVNCFEIANGFSELNDPVDQRERFEDQVRMKEEGDDESHPMDEDFLNAIEVGLPPTGGLGIGVDRIIMLLTQQTSIRDIIFFPTMKPEVKLDAQAPKKEEKVEEVIAPEQAPLDLSNVKVEPLFEEMVDFETFSKSDFRAVKVKDCVAVPKSKKLLQFTLDDGSGSDRTILSGIHEFYEPEELIGKTLVAITNLPPRAMMGVDSCGMLLSAIHEVEGEERLNLLMIDDKIPAGAKLY